MSDVLRVLDVVVGFLSTAGGDPEQQMSSYLHEVLKYPHTHNPAGSLLQSMKVSYLVHYAYVIIFDNFVNNDIFLGRGFSMPETHTQFLEICFC